MLYGWSSLSYKNYYVNGKSKMFESIIIAFTPVVVSGVAWVAKWMLKNGTKLLQNGNRKSILRVVVGVLAFLGVIGQSILTGGEVDPIAIETLAETLVNFFGATGVYFMLKAKKVPTPTILE